MRTFTIFSLAALTAMQSAAFKVPEGLEDGVYSTSMDASGQEILTKLFDMAPMPANYSLPEIESEAPSRKHKRDYIECESVTLTRNDIGNAAYNLGRTCDNGTPVPAKGNLLSVSGDAMAYVCDYYKSEIYCSSDDMDRVVTRVENRCATNRGGFYAFTTSRPNNHITYGYTQAHNTVCYNHD